MPFTEIEYLSEEFIKKVKLTEAFTITVGDHVDRSGLLEMATSLKKEGKTIDVLWPGNTERDAVFIENRLNIQLDRNNIVKRLYLG